MVRWNYLVQTRLAKFQIIVGFSCLTLAALLVRFLSRKTQRESVDQIPVQIT